MSRIDPGEYGWQLIERTVAGDAEAYGRFYDRYFTDVYTYLHRRVRNQRTAEDLTGDTFFRALRAAGTVRRELHSPCGWLITLARAAVREYHRATEVRHGCSTAGPSGVPRP